MPEATAVLKNPLGLHARAAAKVVAITEQFESVILIKCASSGKSADARSILDIMEIGARCGTTVIVSATGRDEDVALAAMLDLFESGFGEI